MSVQLLFFAQAEDWAGCREMNVPCKKNERVIDLIHRHERLMGLIPHRRMLKVAVNHEFKDFEAVIHDGDEIAFLPPVSGG